MTIFTKIKWVASVLLVFFIVLITNIIDRENFNRLSYSVTTMYEDRIVASDLIFEMSRIIHDKELAIVSKASQSLIQAQRIERKINPSSIQKPEAIFASLKQVPI